MSTETAGEREAALVAAGEYASRLGLAVTHLDEGRAGVGMPFSAALLNSAGRIHGGAIASVVLAAARVALATSERTGSLRRPRILSANVSFLAVPARGSIEAVAEVERRGRELAHLLARATDEQGTLIATASFASCLLPPPDGSEVGSSMPERSPGPTAGEALSRSPYLQAADFRVLRSEADAAAAVLPLRPNLAAGPLRIDEGAIAGLVDSCAAYAAHLTVPRSRRRGGVTVQMSILFHRDAVEDVEGRGTVESRTNGTHLASVAIRARGSGLSVASGFAVYRLAPEH